MRKFILFFLFIFMIIGSFTVIAVDEDVLVSMMFFETDIQEALNEISLQTGINIIPDQTVSGVITADLEDIPIEEALDIILKSGGYTYKKVDDFYFVGLADPKSRTFQDLSELTLVELENINVGTLLDVLPANLKDFVEGNPQSNVLTINAPNRHFDMIMKLIDKLDRPKKQVEVSVLVTEIDSRSLEEIGTEFFNFNNTEGSRNELGYNLDDNLFFMETNIFGQLMANIKLLKEEQKASIEADPKVLVAEEESAELFIGDRQIILLDSRDDNTSSRIEKVEVGVLLELNIDRISGEDIIINISPEISHFVESNSPDIIIKESSLSTTVRIPNGQTIAITGMTVLDDSFYSQEVPGLSKVPLLRWLFRKERQSQTEKELLVFVTPVIR
ncbi:MAG: hypothetical protein ACOCRL_02425 [Bacillota bacterium]